MEIAVLKEFQVKTELRVLKFRKIKIGPRLGARLRIFTVCNFREKDIGEEGAEGLKCLTKLSNHLHGAKSCLRD